MARVLARIGSPATHAPAYGDWEWSERDNFPDLDSARGYAEWKSAEYPVTPYRVVRRSGRFCVEYVPSWRLRTDDPTVCVVQHYQERHRALAAAGFRDLAELVVRAMRTEED